MTAATGTPLATGGVVGPISFAGNAPLQPISLLDASSVSADPPTSLSGVVDGMIAVEKASRAATPSRPARTANPSAVNHTALRPASDSDNDAYDGPMELIPSLQGADLIFEAMPIARESLEEALDQFVRQLDHLDAGLLEASGPAPIVVFSRRRAHARRHRPRWPGDTSSRKNSLNRGILAHRYLRAASSPWDSPSCRGAGPRDGA